MFVDCPRCAGLNVLTETTNTNPAQHVSTGGSGVCMVAEFSVIFLFENFQKIRKKWFRNKNVGMSNVELYSHRKPKVFNVQVFCVE